MFKFFKALFSVPATKPHYTICAKCAHYNHPDSLPPFGYFSENCSANRVVTHHLSFITGEKSTGYSGTPEICAEKNTGHCPDFKKRRSLFSR